MTTFAPIPLITTAPPPPPPPLAQTAAPMVADIIPLSELVAHYRELQQRKKDLAETHKIETDPLTQAIAKAQQDILAALAAQGQTSAKTEGGHAIMVQKHSFSVEDPAAFRAWLAENPEGVNLMTNSVSKEALECWINDGKQLPPGVKNSSMISLRVNKP